VEILYEDKYLIIVNKPAGLIVQGARGRVESLLYQLKSFLKLRDQKPGEVFLGVVHRLDKPVSGALVFAKRSKTAGRLFESIRVGLFEKVYLAKVEGKVKETSGKWVDHWEGKEALTYFEVIKRTESASLLLLYPLTGRKHQLRKALSQRGYPVIGDLRYGSGHKVERGKALLLHSLYLSFPHPHREVKVEVIARLPRYFEAKTLDKRQILEFLNSVKKEKEGF